MLHVAAVLSAFVAVQGARPSVESKSLSLHREPSPKEKLEAWKMKHGGRFKDRCSFWGASFNETGNECHCPIYKKHTYEYMSDSCLTPFPKHEFYPPDELHMFPDMQLWAVNCTCVDFDRDREEQPLPEDDDLLRIAAVDFCVTYWFLVGSKGIDHIGVIQGLYSLIHHREPARSTS